MDVRVGGAPPPRPPLCDVYGTCSQGNKVANWMFIIRDLKSIVVLGVFHLHW